MYLKLLLVIIVRTCTDICFKMAVNHLQFSSFITIGQSVRKMLVNRYLWLGLFFGAANMVAWSFSLQDFDLSYAYPFLSVSYITIILSGKVLFKEHLDRNKVIGIVFISLGALVLFLG